MLSYVYPYPAQGRADRPTDEDPVADVAIRACRSVAELYSEALVRERIPHRVGELRLFTRHDPNLADVRVLVDVDPVWEGHEVAGVAVPGAFVDLAPRARALTLLEAVHGAAVRLAGARGWDVDALARCRQHVLDRGLEYRWTSPPKTSPDRRHVAYADFRLTEDGYGRVRLRVVRRDDGATVVTSDEALAFGTSPGFGRAGKSLRWTGSSEVSLVPYDWVPAVRGGRVSLTLRRDGTWRGRVEDYCAARPVSAGDPVLPPLAVRVEGRGAAAPEQPAEIVFVGGGPMLGDRTERFFDAFRAEMARLASPEGHGWWHDAEVRILEIRLDFDGSRAQVRGRLSPNRLAVVAQQPDALLGNGDLRPAARALAEQVVDLVRRRTGLGPHPAFPG